ncbi:MAG: glycosyltransferase [Clostridiales bacterium]|nr:glycosyltransferase [Clostridiales bacterium]
MEKKESKFISIVVYLHNGGSNIVNFFERVLPVFMDTFEKYEIICVDDASTDDSVEVLKEHFAGCEENNIINIVYMSYFQGLEASMNAGRDLAIGDFVYEFDDINCDYDSEIIVRAYDKLLSGYDIVSTSCRDRVKLTSKVFYFFYNLTSWSKNKIGPETFRILSRRAINRVKSLDTYIPYRKAVYMNCGLKTDTIYYESNHRDGRRRRKTNRNERTSLAMDSFIYFTNVLEKTALIISGAFLVFSVGVVIYIISSFFSTSKPVEGWVSTMGFLAFGFFGVFTLLTIILKYLSVLLNLIFKHQRYLVENVEKISRR